MSQQGALSVSTGGGAVVETLTGNSGGAVGPNGSFNIDIVGNNTSGINIVGVPASNLLTVIGIASTTTQQGTVALATNAETIAGTVTTKAVTPDDLKAKLGVQTLHGLPIGASTTGALTWTAAPTNGQLLIGSTGADPVLNNITSTGGSITITNGPGTINLDLAGGGIAFDQIAVDASTPPGTNPVVPSAAGQLTITGAQVAAGTVGANVIRSDSLAVNSLTIEIQRSTSNATSDSTKNGVAHFDSTDFTVDANGFVQLISAAANYTSVVGPTTYAVLAADDYISCDSTAGAITLNFPNAPAANRIWVIKDRTGTAATNAITLSTPGGTVTFDGATSYTIVSNYGAVNLLANATPTYEVY